MFRSIILSSVVFLTAYLLYVMPFFILQSLFLGTVVFSIASLVPTLLAFVLLRFYLVTSITNKLLKGFVYYGMGVGFLAVFILSSMLFVKALIGVDGMIAGVGGLAILGLVTAYCIINANSLSVRKVKVASAKINRATNFAFISDVHIGSNPPRHIEKICERLGTLEFDALLIGGDLFDSSDFKLEDIAALGGLDKEIYFVTGNHEGYVKGFEGLLARFPELNINVLENEAAQLRGINLIGVSDQQPVLARAAAVEQISRKGGFNLVLVHQPSIWEQTQSKVDLMLCGHTHNGQIFPFNFLVRLQFHHVHGLFVKGDSTLYVSSGAGCWGPRMRLGSRNEIVMIELRPA